MCNGQLRLASIVTEKTATAAQEEAASGDEVAAECGYEAVELVEPAGASAVGAELAARFACKRRACVTASPLEECPYL